jgi:2-methylcitrate dehydratase PrpD
VYGGVTVDDILLDRNRHPEVARLSAGMRLVADPALDAAYPARYSSVVEVVTRDGRTLTRRVDAAKGTPEDPLTDEEVRAKFRAATAGVVPAARAAALVGAVEAIERAPNLRPLGALLRARPRRR